MPPVTVFNLRTEDPLTEIEEAIRGAITSMAALEIHDDEVDFVPVCAPDGFRPTVAGSTWTRGKGRREPRMPFRISPHGWPRPSSPSSDWKEV